MIESAVAYSFLKKEVWEKYSQVLDWPTIKQQTPEIYRIFLVIKKWHESKDGDLSLDELPIWFFMQYPGMKDKEKELYAELFNQCAEQNIRDELVVQYLQQLKDIQVRRQIAVMSIDDKIPNDKVIEQIQQLTKQVVVDASGEVEFVTTDIYDLIQLDNDTPGLLWRLECLNKSIGPLKKGMFGVILARVETGKTAMWVSEVTCMAEQLHDDEHICVFFNEENGSDVMWRLYSAATGLTAVELESNPRRARELFYAHGGQRIKFVDQAFQKPTTIYKVLDSLNPKLIVIDNLDKIKGFDTEKKPEQLGKIYQWGRETAKIYAPTIGVSQASESGARKKWLTMEDMADSKTSKPAELDFLLAIGCIFDAGYEYTRFINIPKNKRRGNRYTEEKDRHGKFQVTIQPELSRYAD